MIDIGLDAIHPVQAETMDIDKLVKRYGDRVVYYGGFKTQSILTNGTPDDVKQNVKDTYNTLGRSGVCLPLQSTSCRMYQSRISRHGREYT
jgi:uroporphyrinogen decarboxylase